MSPLTEKFCAVVYCETSDTLSVFQRKWQALSQYPQAHGTLAMLASPR